MKLNSLTSTLVSALVLSTIALGDTSPTPAQSECIPLKVVGTADQVQVRKTVSPPGTVLTRNNWNTDFAVPNGANFQKYEVKIWSVESSNYDVKVNLKYSDGTSDQRFDRPDFTIRSVRETAGKPDFEFSTMPRGLRNQPFQINVFVGGAVGVGNEYTLSAYGCY